LDSHQVPYPLKARKQGCPKDTLLSCLFAPAKEIYYNILSCDYIFITEQQLSPVVIMLKP